MRAEHDNGNSSMSMDAEHLWALARLLVREKQVAQAARCLELCVPLVPPASVAAAHVRILLADCCLTLCELEPTQQDRGVWQKRYKCAERCVGSAEQSGGGATPEWQARLIKCKYLLVKMGKGDYTIKSRQELQTLCDAVRWCCAQSDAGADVSAMQTYFLAEIREALVRMYAETMLVETPPDAFGAFEENLRLVRKQIPSTTDAAFQFWLIEVSCHVLVVAPRTGGSTEATNALHFADQWISTKGSISRILQAYHLIIKGLLLLRTGEIKKLQIVVEELKAAREVIAADDDHQLSVNASQPFIDSVTDALSLEVMSRHDPCQAGALSTNAIHRVQANIQKYPDRRDIHLLLLGLLFDMLFTHCELQRLQARYFEMGVSISQMLTLFRAYTPQLEPTRLFKFYLAQVHVLCAKYAFAIGATREGQTHVEAVLQTCLPVIRPDNAYPVRYIRLWVDLIDAVMYCSPTNVDDRSSASSGSVKQVHPSVVQLNVAAQLLSTNNLYTVVHNCRNDELRAKYDLLVCKWLWATQELHAESAAHTHALQRHEWLEEQRPGVLRMLQDTLQLVSTRVNCTEATSETMALFGSKLIEAGQLESGEETLKNAIRLGIYAKNVVLQSRLLVDVFRLYGLRHLVQAQATTADKYEKKVAQLHRRVAQARADTATSAAVLTWSRQ